MYIYIYPYIYTLEYTTTHGTTPGKIDAQNIRANATATRARLSWSYVGTLQEISNHVYFNIPQVIEQAVLKIHPFDTSLPSPKMHPKGLPPPPPPLPWRSVRSSTLSSRWAYVFSLPLSIYGYVGQRWVYIVDRDPRDGCFSLPPRR